MNHVQYGEVDSIQFGLFSPEEIMKFAICQITNSKLQGPNSLYDKRMGSLDINTCPTCNMDNMKCTGHFGYIDLPIPIIHSEYISKVVEVLKCICNKCAHLLVSREQLVLNGIIPPNSLKEYINPIDLDLLNDIEEEDDVAMVVDEVEKPIVVTGDDDDIDLFKSVNSNKATIKKIIELCSIQDICTHINPETGKICGHIQTKYSVNEGKIEAHYKDKSLTSVTVKGDYILSLFKKMTEEDMTLLGFNVKENHPKDLILTKLLVLPPCSRPPVYDGKDKSDDDFTFKYQEIIKSIHKLNNLEDPTELNVAEDALNFHIKTLFNNSKGKAKHNNGKGRPLKCFRSRISGKKGQIRDNIMGKRVDFSARTVITGDANLMIDEIGIPLHIAKTLTVPVIVNDLNREEINNLIAKNKVNFIIQYDQFGNEILRNLNCKRKPKIKNGDKIERQLQDGDPIILNRQPTLHRPSMQGHKCRILANGKTIRVPLAVVTPYNADFDGDEMNLHAPQDIYTRTDALYLMNVANNIISPQHGKPIMYPIQDNVLGIYLMTYKRVEIPVDHFNDMLFATNSIERFFSIKKQLGENHPDLYTGRILFSCLLPQDFEFYKEIDTKEKDSSDGSNIVKISKGILISGRICKQTIGGNANGIIHLLYKYKSPQIAADFISYTCFLANKFLLVRGFSVGIDDCVCNSNIISDTVHKYSMEAEVLENSNTTEVFKKEIRINNILNEARSIGIQLAKTELTNDNNLKHMVVSGAKGSFINIGQIVACAGQQNVAGKRVQPSISNGTRNIPHYKPHEKDVKSKGFVAESFMDGLDPICYYFHAMGGREGLVDTAIKTRETGYTQHKIIKAFEDIKVVEDHTVRDNCGNIFQFNYGSDGLDTIKTVYAKGQNISTWVDAEYMGNMLNNQYEIQSGDYY